MPLPDGDTLQTGPIRPSTAFHTRGGSISVWPHELGSRCQFLLNKLLMGLEPMTSSLPRKCSTTELQQRQKREAGEGNRTLVFSLEGCCSTIELHPHRKLQSSEPPPQAFTLLVFDFLGISWEDFSPLFSPLVFCSKWGLQDLNLCRHSQRIYSPSPLTTRTNPRGFVLFVFYRLLSSSIVFYRLHTDCLPKKPTALLRSQRRDSNPRPADYKSAALPTELRWPN